MSDSNGGNASPTTVGPLGWLIAVVAVVAIAVGVLWATGALDADETVPPAAPEESDPLLQENGVHSVEEMTVDPDNQLGEQVTLAGQLSAGLPDDPALALLESFEDPEERIILATDGRPLGVFPEVARARVEGTLTRFELPEVEAHIGTDLDEGLFDEYEGELAILVDDVHVFLAGRPAGAIMVGLEGWTVTLTANVDEIYSDRFFTVEDGIVGVLTQNAPTVEAGDTIEVTGTVRLFERDALQDAIDAEVDDDELDDLEGISLVEADEIELLDDLDDVD